MTPLIDREVFFGNPSIIGAQISPDGEYISFIKPHNGMLNIWIKKKNASFNAALPITNDTSRPITSYFWSRDSQYILYVQDKGGDENFHLYAVDPSSPQDGIPKAKDLTDYGSIRAMIMALPKNDFDTIYVGMNDRDPAWHDLYKVSISSGQRTLLYQNDDSINAFYFNLDYKLSLVSRATSDAGTELLIPNLPLRHNERTDWKTLLKCSGDENIGILKFKSKDEVYVGTNIGENDLSFLGILNTSTGKIEKSESDPNEKVDFGGAIFSNRTNKLIATVYTFEKSIVYWRDEIFESDYQYLKDHFNQAEISFASGTENEQEWIIRVNSDVDPGATYFFDRRTKSLSFLYRPRPQLPIEHLNKMIPIQFESTHKLTINAYLTVPSDEHSDQLPGIIMPHGGPWVRDRWGYDAYAQFFANRGYAVLQINYRGSTGYGKAFLNAGDRQWGMDMQDDLTNGVKYLINNNICAEDKIGIFGGSYGGYAALAGLTFTPDIYACGVSIVGPSNLFTLLESIPPYWETARAMFHKRMGDPNTEEGKIQLRAQSPFFHADKIKVPLLVGQGDNDPRVKTAESEQIVSAMKKHNLPVEYLNFPDEGHGFANPDNNMAFTAAMEKFLSTHLGGRYQKDIPDKLTQIIERVTM